MLASFAVKQKVSTEPTQQQNSAMSGMRIGESRVIDILKPPADVKIYRTTEPAEVGK